MVDYGILANVLSTTALFPQLYKTIKTRSVDDMSYAWLLLSVVANAFWIVYALRQKKKEVLFMGSVFTLFYGILLVVKISDKKEGLIYESGRRKSAMGRRKVSSGTMGIDVYPILFDPRYKET